MIRSFRDRETERVFRGEGSRRLSPDIQRRALRKVLLLDAAESLDDLRSAPGSRLEKLIGNRAGQHSIRINDRWRICFRWEREDALEVEILDYPSRGDWSEKYPSIESLVDNRNPNSQIAIRSPVRIKKCLNDKII